VARSGPRKQNLIGSGKQNPLGRFPDDPEPEPSVKWTLTARWRGVWRWCEVWAPEDETVEGLVARSQGFIDERASEDHPEDSDIWINGAITLTDTDGKELWLRPIAAYRRNQLD